MATADSTVTYKEVVGHPGYRVGDDGSVWSRWGKKSLGGRSGTAAILTDRWRRLNPSPASGGYCKVTLNGMGVRVHTVVLTAFIGPKPDGLQGCHNDGNPANNVLSNLRWDTIESNNNDRNHHGTHNKGERNGQAKLTAEIVKRIRSEYAAGTTQTQLAREYKVHCNTIHEIVHRRNWKSVA